MRAAILVALLVLGACAPATHRGGIVSTNPCADAMLVELVPAQRIAAISHYSRDPGSSSIDPAIAARFPVTAGTAEEVIALHPDLVVTSSLTPAPTRAAYAQAGLRVVTLDSPTSIAASEAQVRALAAAVGATAAGEAMVARIEAALVQYSAPRRRPGPSGGGLSDGAARSTNGLPPTGPRPSGSPQSSTLRGAPAPGSGSGDAPSALLFISGNLANGSGTLLDALMRQAGLRNAAAGYGLAFTGRLPIETIAARPPRVILSPDDSDTGLRRAVLAKIGANVVQAPFPRQLMNCGGPVIVPALARLAAIRRSLS